MTERKTTLRLTCTREWLEHKLMHQALEVIRERTEPEPWEHPSEAHQIAEHVLEEVGR